MTAVLSTPALGAATSRLPTRSACRHAAAAAPGRPRPRRQLTVAMAKAKAKAKAAPMSEADLYQPVDPAPLPVLAAAPPPAAPPAAAPAGVPGIGGQPWYFIAPLAFMGLIAVLRTAKAVKKKMAPAGNRLEQRGFKKGGVADDQTYSRAIKGMKKMKYEELSDEQIEAARKRRRREVEKDEMPMDLEQIQLPDNHPFAIRRKLAPEEEAQQYNRLHARRGLSPEDMQRLREQQALADQMDAEGDARDAGRRARG